MILSAMLALAPHGNPAPMQPIAEAIERMASGPTEQSVLVALWYEGGMLRDNPFRLRIPDRRMTLEQWRLTGRWGSSLDAEAASVVQLLRGAYRVCAAGARTRTAERIAYFQGRACVPTAWDERIAARAATILPLLGDPK